MTNNAMHRIITFIEQIEMSEDYDMDKKVVKVNNSKGNKTKKTNTTSGQKCSMFHGNNNTHAMEECNTLMQWQQQRKASL